MKILLVGRNCHVGGGCTFRYRASLGLMARGHELHLAAQGGPMEPRFVEAGVRMHRVPPTPFNRLNLWALCRRERFDMVHACNSTAGDDVMWVAQRMKHRPFVVSVHGVLHENLAGNACLRRAGEVIAFDEGALSRLREIEFLKGRTLRLVRRPVQARDIQATQSGANHIVMVSRLSKSKSRGALAAIQAVNELRETFPTLHLTIVGDGSARAAVEARAGEVNAHHGGKVVELVGALTDPLPTMSGAACVVGTAYVALEALYHGIPVVAAGYDGYGLITPENLAEAVDCNFGDSLRGPQPPISAEFLTSHLRDALTRFAMPQGAGEMQQMRERVVSNHSLSAVAESLEVVYQAARGDANQTVRAA